MLNFLVRRLGTIVPTLVFVSMLIFGLQQLLPGDPAVVLAGEDRDPNVVAYLHEKLHLDEPLPVRYGYWLRGVVQGDLGESMRVQQPVLDLILPYALAREPITPGLFAELGYGGLLQQTFSARQSDLEVADDES